MASIALIVVLLARWRQRQRRTLTTAQVILAGELYDAEKGCYSPGRTASACVFALGIHEQIFTKRQGTLETMTEVKLISGTLFNTVAALAAASPRLRMNHNFHSDPADNPHRFLNVLLPGTYVRPHRHLDPPKAESFVVLEGIADVILFDDHGAITARYRLGAESPEVRIWGVDLPPGVWHTIVPRTARVVCFEVKPGPWISANDKEFASWAPAENDPDSVAYCKTLADG